MRHMKDKHTPGPLFLMEEGFNAKRRNPTIYAADDELRYIAEFADFGNIHSKTDNLANAKFTLAAYNAFDSAASRLGISAIDLAEALQDGGIAELVSNLRRAETLLTAAHKFIDENLLESYTVFYDNAKCDGSCLKDESKEHAESIVAILAKIRKEGE